jgi:hypothetical protein
MRQRGAVKSRSMTAAYDGDSERWKVTLRCVHAPFRVRLQGTLRSFELPACNQSQIDNARIANFLNVLQ